MKCPNKNCNGTLTLSLDIEPVPYYRGEDENPGQIELTTYCSLNHKVKNPPFSDYLDILYWVQNNYDKIKIMEEWYNPHE